MGGPTPFIDLTYSYDGVGNVMSIIDILNSANNKGMQYDNLNRLTNSDGPWGQNGAFELGTFTYDALGNRDTSIIGSNSAAFTYSTTTNRLNNLTYDNNGNVTGDGNFTYTYDADNRLTQVTNGIDTITYEYDGEGRRITQTKNGVTTLFVYGTGLNVLAEFDGFGVPKVDYIYAGTRAVAKEEFDVNGDPVKKTFFHADHLGSSRSITDLETTEIWDRTYLPYGETLTGQGADNNTHQYTGKEIDEMTNNRVRS